MKDCIFCSISRGETDPGLTIYQDDQVFVQVSLHQKLNNRGHVLVVPKRHCRDLLELPDDQDASLLHAVKRATAIVSKAFAADGIQVRQNNGLAAGQDVFHLHFHVIPRYENDGFETADYETVPIADRALQAEKLKRYFFGDL